MSLNIVVALLYSWYAGLRTLYDLACMRNYDFITVGL